MSRANNGVSGIYQSKVSSAIGCFRITDTKAGLSDHCALLIANKGCNRDTI
jgi:hypothetical protein